MFKRESLRKTKTNKHSCTFIFFDVESNLDRFDNNKVMHSFRLGHAEYVRIDDDALVVEEESLPFRKVETFFDFIEEKAKQGRTLHVIAHNVKYDAQIIHLLENLVERGWTLVSVYDKNTTVILRLKKQKMNLIIEDGLNRLRGSIKELGKSIGLEKLEVDYYDVSDDVLSTYCQRDVEILKIATLRAIKFIHDNDLGSLRSTIASQAFTAFKHRFMKPRIYHLNIPDVVAAERAAYHGGYVRALHIIADDNGDYYQLDVNSMYPYVMKANKYPTRYVGELKDKNVDELRHVIEHGCVIALLTVRPKRPYFPLQENNRTLYPLTRFTAWFTTPEVEELIRQNAILKIHEVHLYLAKEIFGEYVDFFYEIKRSAGAAGDKATAMCAKLFLNSLYGKFGAYQTSFERAPDYDHIEGDSLLIKDAKTGKVSHVIKLFNQAYMVRECDEGRESVVAIAAHVTAYARLYLCSLIEKAGIENAYYCDTDSIIVNRAGYERLNELINPLELGKLKLEKRGKRLVVMARKDYILDDKVVRKGVDIKNAKLGIMRNETEIWPGLISSIKQHRNGNYVTHTINKNLKREIVDGVVSEGGLLLPFTEIPTKFVTAYDVLNSNVVFQACL